jgi:beta-N-acetylhexosaminidase
MLAFAALRLIAALTLVTFALDWRSPQLTGVRPLALAILLVGPSILIAFEIWLLTRRRERGSAARGLRIAIFAAATFALLTVASLEARFHWQRQQVLAADVASIARLGQHFVIGFSDWQEVRKLVERRAIAGIYVSASNMHDTTAAELRGRVDEMQAIRRQQGLPPLWITTDQEGGGVSRLSPPLVRMPSLATVINAANDAEGRRTAVQQYATAQGRELADAGINLNFAPVVDINFHVKSSRDVSTRIYERAISDDPETVSSVALSYCASLQATKVRCTLKHFPGLGRVSGDTHRESATLTASLADLERIDWVPFRALARSGAVTMVGHVHFAAIDNENPASISQPVIGLLRRELANDGLLITDDFSMLAIARGPGGLTGATVAALNAGIDLILISYDFDQYYPAMYALLAAERDGALRADALRESERRLALTKPLNP